MTSFASAELLCLRKLRLRVHAAAWLREISGANWRWPPVSSHVLSGKPVEAVEEHDLILRS